MKRVIAIILIYSITLYLPQPFLWASQEEQTNPLEPLLQKSHLELFEQASDVTVSKPLIEIERERIKQEKEQEKKRLEQKKNRIEDEIDRNQDLLDDLNQDSRETAQVAERRHQIHCEIQRLRKELQETKLILDNGLETRYDNKLAKLKILEEWPAEYRKAQQMLESGEAAQRKFGDFRDIGFRDGPFEGQKDDIKTGREAIDEMRRQNILPPEIEDEQIVEFMSTLANRIARSSDLKVPLKLHVLRSEEINAFALPGGFLFVNSGLIMETSQESELAGVVAHEISHVTARHGDRLMTKANIANIIFQAAQIAALIFSGGISSIGAYYALQYGFFGLGLVMNLTLLGVTREYEIEADILGTQYLWDAGYDTKGFMRFFSHMAQKEGYITGLSWFRTHPPFYKRMEVTFREITFLPQKEEVIMDSDGYHQMKDRLKQVLAEMEKQDRDAPTLKRVYDCDDQEESPAPPSTNY